MAADVLLLGLALDLAGRTWLIVPLGLVAVLAIAGYRVRPELANLVSSVSLVEWCLR